MSFNTVVYVYNFRIYLYISRHHLSIADDEICFEGFVCKMWGSLLIQHLFRNFLAVENDFFSLKSVCLSLRPKRLNAYQRTSFFEPDPSLSVSIEHIISYSMPFLGTSLP